MIAVAELLTHVLVAYVIATASSLRYPWITPPYVTMAMIGAMFPDLNRIGLFLPEWTVEAILGVPFSWGATHTGGGSLVIVTIGALLVPARIRWRVFAMLLLGMVSHHALDLLLWFPSGYAYPALWPLTSHALPAGNLYLSTDRWPAVLAAAVAALVWYVVRRREAPEGRGA